MAAVFETPPGTPPQQDELAALELLLRALCEQIGHLIDAARSDDRLGTREAQLQLAAFEERRQRAISLLDTPSPEPCPVRIGNLEKIVEALDCSRAYFSASTETEPMPEPAATRSIRVR
ncbi:MAG TPA: hypothetical protein VLD39_03310 [Gammaproteobacteria bacterium]|nr:hypothetical protein [Gammaproteobacteria bacterium]